MLQLAHHSVACALVAASLSVAGGAASGMSSYLHRNYFVLRIRRIGGAGGRAGVW
jgi:hypothetical protein